jgi:hypothetical protein
LQDRLADGAEGAGGTLAGVADGSDLGRAGRLEEADTGRFVVPHFGVAVAIADQDGRGGGLLKGEAQLMAGHLFGWAVTAQVRRDLVVALGDLVADDAAIVGHAAVIADLVRLVAA